MENLNGTGSSDLGTVDIAVSRLAQKTAYDNRGDSFEATCYLIKITEYTYQIIDDQIGLTEQEHIREIEASLKDIGVTDVKWQ